MASGTDPSSLIILWYTIHIPKDKTLTITTRKSVSSLKGWTKQDVWAWNEAHKAELPFMADETKEIGTVKLAGKGAGSFDPHFFVKTSDIKTAATFRAELEVQRNYLPALTAAQFATRAAWVANDLQATIEVTRSYRDLRWTSDEQHDWQAKGRATQEINRNGRLNSTTIELGAKLPKHLSFDRNRGIAGTSDKGKNNTVLVPLTAATDRAIEDAEVTDVLDWAKNHITAGQFRAVFNWITGAEYTSAQKAKGLNALKVQAAEWDTVRRTITGRHYCWTTVDAQFTTNTASIHK